MERETRTTNVSGSLGPAGRGKRLRTAIVCVMCLYLIPKLGQIEYVSKWGKI